MPATPPHAEVASMANATDDGLDIDRIKTFARVGDARAAVANQKGAQTPDTDGFVPAPPPHAKAASMANASDDGLDIDRIKTFAHVGDARAAGANRKGAQTLDMDGFLSMIDAHLAGICRPCPWFTCADGCANGNACRHCHLCTADDEKDYRRVKSDAAGGLGDRAALLGAYRADIGAYDLYEITKRMTAIRLDFWPPS
eukprot:CAMPEP_0176244038 /NCGR_PEP_ID=MMETSP0121_2-20121125/31229_1 /TAXON_ID=160619 /ORGANISM="Kryptoperidinium foliaceum, Strain CCMP 1326" /LENGTH=198 /DNA_ID=CAMNT_0017583641 /DNA_START=1 /DNA_END=598 /DNA_ORIENTATION=+